MAEEEGAAGDDRREECADRRGTGVRPPAPTRSAAEGAPGTQRGTLGWHAKPVEGDKGGPAAS